MSLELGRNRLFKDLETLQKRWGQTEVHWQDAVKEDFLKEYIDPLSAAVLAVVAAADRLSPSLQQARQDCGDGGGSI